MNMASESAAINILLVEDDPGDVLITREALSAAKILHNLAVVDNGEEAVSYLRNADNTVTPPDLTLCCST